jgi:hypothetical protein
MVLLFISAPVRIAVKTFYAIPYFHIRWRASTILGDRAKHDRHGVLYRSDKVQVHWSFSFIGVERYSVSDFIGTCKLLFLISLALASSLQAARETKWMWHLAEHAYSSKNNWKVPHQVW